MQAKNLCRRLFQTHVSTGELTHQLCISCSFLRPVLERDKVSVEKFECCKNVPTSAISKHEITLCNPFATEQAFRIIVNLPVERPPDCLLFFFTVWDSAADAKAVGEASAYLR
jgi:hypothetical protein